RIECAKLRVVESVVELTAELEFPAFVNGDILEHSDVPVVEARPAQRIFRQGSESAHSRQPEYAGVEVPRESLVARGQIRIADDQNARRHAGRPDKIHRSHLRVAD